MFRKMRRGRQEISLQACEEILAWSTSGVLALSGKDGAPYAVPLSFVYRKGRLWFHSAPEGHKIDLIRENDRVSFCVIDQDRILPERYTTAYRSVILFGRARIVKDEGECRRALELLAEKYAPGRTNTGPEIDGAMGKVCVVEVTAQRITGKIGRELLTEQGGE